MLHFIISLIVGAIAGYVAGMIMGSKGGWIRNIILGVVGGGVGSAVLGLIGISGSGFWGNIVVSIIGACILIAVARWITKGK